MCASVFYLFISEMNLVEHSVVHTYFIKQFMAKYTLSCKYDCTSTQVSARTEAGYGDISRVVVDLPNGPRKSCAVFGIHMKMIVHPLEMSYLTCMYVSSWFHLSECGSINVSACAQYHQLTNGT